MLCHGTTCIFPLTLENEPGFVFCSSYPRTTFPPIYQCLSGKLPRGSSKVNQSVPKCPETVCYNSKGNEAYIMKPRSNRLINTSLFLEENDPVLNSSGLYNILIYYLLQGWLLYKFIPAYSFSDNSTSHSNWPSQLQSERNLTGTSRY